MKGSKSPALVNLAVLVFGWVFLRLCVMGFSASPPEFSPGKRQDFASAALASLLSQPAASEETGHTIPESIPHIAARPPHIVGIRPRKPWQNTDVRVPVPHQDFLVRNVVEPIGPTVATNGAAQTIMGPSQSGRPLRNWQLSGYALVRTGSGQAGIAANGQLGGSQIGLRAQRLIIRSGRFSLSANGRISAPIAEADGKEAGIGFAVKRSARIPIEFIVERRVRLDRGGRNAVAGLIATGFDDFRLPAKLLLSGYVQAGAVGLKMRDGFIDGAVRAEHALLDLGKANIRLGAVIAGSAQQGVSRVDIGPTVAARFRLAKASVRVSAEWRERVGGTALPGSGPAITVGFDY